MSERLSPADCATVRFVPSASELIIGSGHLWAVRSSVLGSEDVTTEFSRRAGAIPVRSSTYGYGLRTLGGDRDTLAAVNGHRIHVLQPDRMREFQTPPSWRCGDPVPVGDAVIAVADEPDCNTALVMRLSARSGAVERLVETEFAAQPSVSGDGQRMAWTEWESPHMPWQRSWIMLADLQATGLANARRVSPSGCAAAQPCFAPSGHLWFICDANGVNRLWTFDGERAREVTAQQGDIGLSTTSLTGRSYAFCKADRVAALTWRNGRSELIDFAAIDGRILTSRRVDLPIADQIVFHHGQRILAQITGEASIPREVAIVTRAGPLPAWYWSATRASGLTIIDLHGGPTGYAAPVLSQTLQALHADGHGILLLNYRGSSGYGIPFRDALDAQWGVADVEDVAAVVSWIARDKGRRDRVVVRGASAGGFTALNAAAIVDGIGGAIVYYGVSDLAALARATHRYERGYLMTLTGAMSEDDPVLAERSPINRMDSISAPLLLLHGDRDEVAPLAQMQSLHARLTDQGRQCALHVMAGEGHGFRNANTLERCLAHERRFLNALRF